MNKCVVDASVLLAVIGGERDWEQAVKWLENAAMSAVNLSEVAAKLSERGAPTEEVQGRLQQYRLRIIPFDRDLAFLAGDMRTKTRSLGLSLGDRACIATGIQLSLPIITAEREWKRLDIGASIELIR